MNNIDALQQQLVVFAKSVGIDKIGFTTADPFLEMKNRLKRQQELNYQSGFEEENIELRTEPTQILEEATTIISVALAYPSRMKDAPRSVKGERRGIFCRASWGIDYHTVLREKIQLVEAWIIDNIPGAKIKSMVDTGALVDRAVAERAGIGWAGKNCSIITPEFGSYVYLGDIITNVPFIPDQPIEDQCGECTLCIDVCPTGALIQPGQLDAKRCIAFLTQTKTMLPDEFRSKIGNRLYGCDTCQTVCPKNKGKINWMHEEFMPDPELAKPLLKPLLHMSNKEFKQTFGHISGSWRGKKPIQRNALLALAHFKDETALPDLLKVLETDERPVIRGTAAWAIGKIGLLEAKVNLLKALEKEQDEEAKAEILKGLDLLEQKERG